jgi:threonine dehydrogenase-like Zn-dependent dehydrogenase
MIRVHLAGICATDLEISRGYMQFTGVPGHEFVGTVIAGHAPLIGRRVVAEINCACLECDLCQRGRPNHCRRRTVLGIAGRDGAFAEYLAVPARNCHVVPDNVTDQQAVFVEPLAAAVHVLDAAPLTPGARVAVLGSGRLGLLVAQVLALQDCELEVVGRNRQTLAFCARRGIATRLVDAVDSHGQHDVVVECTGSPEGLRVALRLIRPQGTIVLKSTYAEPAGLDLAPLVVAEVRVVGNRCGVFPPALHLLADHRVEVDALVSGVYPLERGVEALEAAARPENIKVLLQPGLK